MVRLKCTQDSEQCYICSTFFFAASVTPNSQSMISYTVTSRNGNGLTYEDTEVTNMLAASEYMAF